MRELELRELKILEKLQTRTKILVNLNFLEVKYFRRGTYTCCILILYEKIVGIGMTKKYKRDRENQYIADDVSFAKAAKDYLIGDDIC